MLNVVNIPTDIDDGRARKRLLEMGIGSSAGFGPLKGKAWRVGLMGYNANLKRVDRLLGGLEEVIAEQRRS